MCVQVPSGARRGCWFAWSWSYRLCGWWKGSSPCPCLSFLGSMCVVGGKVRCHDHQSCEKKPFPVSLDIGIFILAGKDLGLVLGKGHEGFCTEGQVTVEWGIAFSGFRWCNQQCTDTSAWPFWFWGRKECGGYAIHQLLTLSKLWCNGKTYCLPRAEWMNSLDASYP